MRKILWAGLAFLSLLALLTACETDPFGRSASEVRAEKAACDAKGGTFGPGGITGALMCFTTNPDAGKSCSREDDCTGFCDADTRTCSSTSPAFGCFNFLDDNGEPASLCVD